MAYSNFCLGQTKTFSVAGNFSLATNWTDGILPIAGDNLIINANCTVDAATNNLAYGTLTIGTATGRTLSWPGGGTNTLNVSNVSAGAAASTLNMNNGGKVIIRGTWTSTNLTFTPGPALGTGTIEIRSSMTLPAAYTVYNNLIINGVATTVALGATFTANTSLAVTSGTLNLGTFTANRTTSGVGPLTVSNGATLRIGGTNTLPSTYTTHAIGATSTVNYSGTTQSVVVLNSAQSYGHLTISGSGTKTLAGTENVAGNLTVSAGTFDLGANTINRSTAGGAVTVSDGATLKIGGANSFPTNYSTSTWGITGTSTVDYSGTAQAVGIQNYDNLTLSNSGTKTFGAGSTRILSAFTISGTATADLITNLSTLSYWGNGPQTVLAQTYYNLSFDGSGGSSPKALSGNVIVNNNLAIANSATVDLGTFTANRAAPGGTFSLTGTAARLKVGGTNTLPSNYSTHVVGPTTTIEYNGTTQSVATLNSAQDYGNLIISGSGIKTLAGTENVAGDLTIAAGTFDLGSFTVDRASAGGGILSIASLAILKINGTNTLPSNYLTHSIASASTVEYAGTNQIIAGLNSGQEYNGLTISGSGTKTLAGDLNVAGNLTLASGTVTTGAYTLYSKVAGNVFRVSGWVNGNLKRRIPTGTPTRIFDVGDANNYTPVTVVFASITTAGDLTVSLAGGDHSNIVNSNISPSLSVNRSWSLTNSGIVFTTYGATFTFVAGDLDAGANTSAFIVGKYSAGSWTYPTVGTKTGSSTEATGLTAFSDFQLGEFAATYNISGKVFEDMNYGDGAGRSLASSSGVARPGARVELFDSGGTYQTFTTTDASGNYTFSLQAGTYTVRVVNNTVTTSRGVLTTTTPNQTFRTDASSGAAVAVTDHVGGEAPGLIDAFDGSTTLAVLTTGTNTPQSITSVALSSGNISGVDFGYCFNVIVNANNQGQGSLRRVLIYTNAMPNTGLAQSGLTAGIDHAIFMLADGNARPGLTASYPSQFVSGVATISLATAYPTITDPMILDASLQPGYATVPIIELNGAAVTGAGFTITAGSSTVRGFIINRFTDATTGIGVSISAAGNNTITGNYIGTNALGTAASANTRTGILINSNNNIVGGLTAGAGNLISGNGKGVVIVGGAGNAILANTIYDNTGIGIDLADDGVTVNDGTKSGALVNSGMDAPVFTTMTLGGTTLTISGYVGSAAGQATFASASVEVFKADNDASGFGEGQTLLGTLTTDVSGNFSGALTVSLAIGDKITGTATDGSNNTSEFAANITVVAPPIKTFTGTGSFSDASKWTGGTVPVAGEDLVIDGASTVDNNAGTDNITFGTLTIGTATGRTLSWATSGTNRLNVSNVSAGAAASILDMTNGGTLIIRGTWTSANLTFTPGAGTIDVRSTITLPAAYSTYSNLVINGSSNTVTAGVGIGVTNFTINSGTVDLNTLTLTTTGTAVYTAGTINNGTATSSGATSVFSGTVFGAIVNATSDVLYLNGSTFNNTVTLTKNGPTDILCTGGNTFNNTATIVSNGTGYFVLGTSAADIFSVNVTFTNTGSDALFFAFNSPGNQFNGDVTFNNTGTGTINSTYGALATATFNGNIFLNNTSAAGISFGATGGITTLPATRTINVGGTGYSAGPLYLYFFNQMGSTPQSLTLTGTAALIPGFSTTFNGNVNFIAPQIILNGATFNGTAYIEKNGALQNNSLGGNVFNSTTSLVNSGSGHFVLGYPTGVDIYNGDLTLSNTGTAFFFPAYNNAGHQFNGNLILNETSNTGIYFCFGTGTATLAAGKTISIGGLGFSAGVVHLNKFTQIGATSQTLSLTGTATLQIGPASTFNGNVSFTAPQLYVNGSTYNGTATLTKNGATDNTSDGGNTYNSTATITNNGTGFLRLANLTADDFNGDATFMQTGGGLLQPAYATNNTFAGNISTAGTATAITFGAGAGTVTLNGTGAQSMSGSMPANFNDITVTNTATPGVSVQNDQNLLGVLTLAPNVVFDADGTGNTAIFKLISTGDNPTQDASVAVLPSGALVSGNVTVQRFMTIEGPNGGRIYRYISSPVQNATVADLQQEIPVSGSFTNSSVCSGCSTNGQSLFAYNETVITDASGNGTADRHDGYIDFPAVTNSETFQPGEGYALYVRGNILGSALWDLRGPINSGNVTPVSFAITHTSSGTLANDGWNLVGNPFPSTIDWNAASGWTKTNLDGTIYITDNGNASQQYATWNGVTGTNGGTPDIAIGQGFWVKGNGLGAPVLQANENIKTPGTQTSFFREKSPENLLRITMVKGTTRDETVIHFREDATKVFDSHADAMKLMNTTFNLFTSQEDGTNLAINSMPAFDCNSIVKLNIGNVSAGDYQMDFSEYESFPEVIAITLYDKFTSLNINPREPGSYDFSITADTASYSSDRFKISFVTIPVNPDFVVSIAPICEGSDARVQIDNSQQDAAYVAILDGTSTSTPVIGNGGEIVITIPQDKLTSGQNVINVRSSMTSCISGAIDRPVAVIVEEKHDVTFVEHGGSCQGGAIRLAAFGAEENGYYNWHESIESEIAITGQHNSVFVTPILQKSRTYYVSVANVLGCEGLREAVFAEVVQLEPAQIIESGKLLLSNYPQGNQWYHNDIIVAGATESFIEPGSAGRYTVAVTINDCTITSPEYLFVVTEIDITNPNSNITLSPNPATNKISIEIPDSFENVRVVEIINMSGRLVGTIDLHQENGRKKGEVLLTNYSSGVYIIRIIGSRRRAELRFVKL